MPHMRRDMRREACPAAGPWRVHITLYAQHQTHTMESYSRATAGVGILHSMASTGAFFIPSNSHKGMERYLSIPLSRDCSVYADFVGGTYALGFHREHSHVRESQHDVVVDISLTPMPTIRRFDPRLRTAVTSHLNARRPHGCCGHPS